MPVAGEKAAWTPCHAPLDVPQKVDQKGAIESASTGVSCSWTCTCSPWHVSGRPGATLNRVMWPKLHACKMPHVYAQSPSWVAQHSRSEPVHYARHAAVHHTERRDSIRAPGQTGLDCCMA